MYTGLLMENYRIGEQFKAEDGTVLGLVTFICDEFIRYTTKWKFDLNDNEIQYHMSEVELNPNGPGIGHPYNAKGEFSIRGKSEQPPTWW